MTERSAKKLGEVLAFAEVGLETLARGSTALSQVLGSELIESIKVENTRHFDTVTALVESLGVQDITKEKATATGEKLRAMRDLYVKDQWDNGTELLEWSGFFEGAATVHWSLVLGIVEKGDFGEFADLAKEALNFHHDLLETAREKLRGIGLSYEE